MPARWDALPSKARAQVPRQPVLRGVWRCEGVRGCGEVIDDTWAAAERHSDEHHGSRLAVVFGAQRDTVISPTTEGEQHE